MTVHICPVHETTNLCPQFEHVWDFKRMTPEQIELAKKYDNWQQEPPECPVEARYIKNLIMYYRESLKDPIRIRQTKKKLMHATRRIVTKHTNRKDKIRYRPSKYKSFLRYYQKNHNKGCKNCLMSYHGVNDRVRIFGNFWLYRQYWKPIKKKKLEFYGCEPVKPPKITPHIRSTFMYGPDGKALEYPKAMFDGEFNFAGSDKCIRDADQIISLTTGMSEDFDGDIVSVNVLKSREPVFTYVHTQDTEEVVHGILEGITP